MLQVSLYFSFLIRGKILSTNKQTIFEEDCFQKIPSTYLGVFKGFFQSFRNLEIVKLLLLFYFIIII